MRQKKVLQITGNLNVGGLQTVAMNWARYTDKDKLHFDFLVYGNDIGENEKEAAGLGCKVIHLEKPKDQFHFYRAIKKVIYENGPYDVVYSHTLFSSGVILKAAHACGVKKCIAHSHTIERPSGRRIDRRIFYAVMRKWLNKYADVRLACSIEAGKYVFGRNSSFTVLPNGIIVSRYVYSTMARTRIRSEFGLKGEFVLGNVGRFAEAKNHFFMLQVFKELRTLIPQSRLLLVGDGELKNKTEERAKELGLYEYTIFTGNRSDISDVLSAMDVFIFPSIFEGLGIVGIEAQANGLVTICSDKVPKEVGITDLLKFKALSDGVKAWANVIAEYAGGYPRGDMSGTLMEKGYDVMQSAKEIEKILLN